VINLHISYAQLYQCRQFATFDDKVLESCHPYLTNTSTYYLVGTEGLDASTYEGQGNGFPFSLLTQVANIVKSSMNPKCTSNVMSSVCQAAFKECRQVEDETGQELWLPSLLCKNECERKKTIWDKCILEIETDPTTKEAFDIQMGSMVRVCAAASFCFCFHRHPLKA
jgi:hypothetical protein